MMPGNAKLKELPKDPKSKAVAFVVFRLTRPDDLRLLDIYFWEQHLNSIMTSQQRYAFEWFLTAGGKMTYLHLQMMQNDHLNTSNVFRTAMEIKGFVDGKFGEK